MEWIQFITIIATILGGAYYFKMLIQHEINVMREQHTQDVRAHREDMQLIDSKWERLFERMDRKMEAMDEKWHHFIMGERKKK